MAISKDEAQDLTRRFLKDYPGGLALAYRFRQDTVELYGARAEEVPPSMKGGYLPKEAEYNGRSYLGRVDIPLANIGNTRDLLQTLRHEVLGHYGANTFKPEEKMALLDAVIDSRNQPGIKEMWESVSQVYKGSSTTVQAEEVFALQCEGIAPIHHVHSEQVRQLGQQSIQETCIHKTRPLKADDLFNIACMVAQGLHDRSLTQKTFPQINELLRRDDDMEKKPFHEVVAEKLIEQLKTGTAPWQKPWQPGEPNALLPMNPTTGKRYKGINAINLMSQGHSDPRWMTYNQADAAGAQVRKGEKSTPVQYWKFSEEQDKLDDKGKPVLDENGKPVKELVKLERPRVFFASVFNAEQIEGLLPIQRKEHTWDAVDRAEKILSASGADIRHGGNGAFYRPSSDNIQLPEKSQFPSSDNYYATALHELGHWTGHNTRLDRDLAHPFGSEGYAKEELRAEIASMIIGDELGIGHDPEQHAAYVGSWIKALQDDPLEIFRASSDAEKIFDFVMVLEQKLEQVQQEKGMEAMKREEPIYGVIRRDGAAEEVLGQFETLEQACFHAAGELDTKELILMQGDTELKKTKELFTYLDALSEARTSPYMEPPKSELVSLRDMAYKSVLDSSEADLKSERQYIDVPFKEKDQVKNLGARWDRQEQSWFIPPGVDSEPFKKWTTDEASKASAGVAGDSKPQSVSENTKEQKNGTERVYLAVPYGERLAAKAAGAEWDKAAKSWYAGANADMERLERWKPENVKSEQGPALNPREEFSQALQSLGFILKGEHPIMDGQRHRVTVEGDKKGEQAGFYVGHLDGHPAGFIKNNRTGIEMKWKSKGYSLGEEEKAKLHAEAAAKLADRAAEQAKQQEATADRVTKQAASLLPVTSPTPYMESKGIKAHSGLLTDKEGQKTYVPAFDINGKQWTMQYIQEDGTKRFAKDSKKEACFHPVGGMVALAAAPVLVISEGYATAATLTESLGHATVAAFDSGNLPAVARALHDKFPDKSIIIAGDDDKHQVITQGTNPGRTKAEEAAKQVGGVAIFPIFSPGEATWPENVPAITPASYRAHERASQRLEASEKEPDSIKLSAEEMTELKQALLSQEQLDSLGRLKSHTDFNDIATRSELGSAGVERQATAAVGLALKQIEERQEKQVSLVEKKEEEKLVQTEKPRMAMKR